MAQVSRNHHFVSNCYLSRFTDTGTKKGTLWVFDLIARRSFQQKPKNIAYKRDFNRVNFDGFPPDVLEAAFGEIEGKAAGVIQRICKEAQLPGDEEFSYVLNLIALFAVRNPAMRRSMTVARRHEYRVIADLLTSDRGLYQRHHQTAPAAGFVSETDVTFEQVQEFVRRDDYTVEISPQVHLQTELAVFENTLTSASSRHWSLLTATPEAPDFITCDHPASLVYKQAVFPLDPRYALMGDRDSRAPRMIAMDTEGVAEVNSRMLRLADRQVYSRTSEVAHLKDGKALKETFSTISCLCG